MLMIRKDQKHVIREKINIKNQVLDYTRNKQLNWHGHVQRMNERFWNYVHLEEDEEEEEEEEKEDLEIRGCRKQQQELEKRELTTRNVSTEKNGEEK